MKNNVSKWEEGEKTFNVVYLKWECVPTSRGHYKDLELIHGKEPQCLYTVTTSVNYQHIFA